MVTSGHNGKSGCLWDEESALGLMKVCFLLRPEASMCPLYGPDP